MDKKSDEYKKYIVPFVRAILDPSLEEVAGLNKFPTEELVEIVKNFSDKLILGLAMENQEHKGRYGFILNPRAFGFPESEERLAEVATALLNRFAKAQNNNSDWEKYVCQVRKKLRKK